MQNKLERKENNRKYTQHKMLWVGMYAGENNKSSKALSYRTKAEERDRLKLEREEWK